MWDLSGLGTDTARSVFEWDVWEDVLEDSPAWERCMKWEGRVEERS